jgi:hypothetical protein
VADEDGDEVQEVVRSRHYGQPAAHNEQGERHEEHRAPPYAEREKRPIRGRNCYCILIGLGAAKWISLQFHCNGTVLQLNFLLSIVCAEDIPRLIVGLVGQRINTSQKFAMKLCH